MKNRQYESPEITIVKTVCLQPITASKIKVEGELPDGSHIGWGGDSSKDPNAGQDGGTWGDSRKHDTLWDEY